MKKEVKTSILMSILFLIVGIVLVLYKDEVVKYATYLFGGIFLFLGLIYFVQYWKSEDKKASSMQLYSGIMSAMIGIILMFCAEAVELAIRIITGIWILYRAFINLHYALVLKDLNMPTWMVSLVVSFFFFAAGLYVILKGNLVISTLGIIIILYALLELGTTINEIVQDKRAKKITTENVK